jgi:hypothetical protein
MADQQRLTIDIAGEENANELRDEIRRETPGILEADQLASEIGTAERAGATTLVIMATTAAIASLAKILSHYFQRRPEVEIRIQNEKRVRIQFDPRQVDIHELQKLITEDGSGQSIDPVDPWPRRR